MRREIFSRNLLVIGVLLIAEVTMVVAQNNSRVFPIKADQAVISNINVTVSSLGVARFDAAGFRPYETVDLYVESTSSLLPFDVVLAQWAAVADQNGAISATWTGGIGEPDLFVRAVGSTSAITKQTRFSIVPITTTANANIDQCRNGSVDLPNDCSAANWVNGNVNATHGHFIEGDSVPYRIVLSGIDTTVPHTVTIQWDTTENGHHAIDYLTSFDRTEPATNPCYSVAGCDQAIFTEMTIPPDPHVLAGARPEFSNVAQIGPVPGNFRMYGGTLLNASEYTLFHDYSSTSHTAITLTFTASVANPVLAWGGHISTRADWGVGNSAISISGSPFHMRLMDLDGSGGNQDLALASDAVYYPGDVTIIKDSQPDSVIFFDFTAVGPDVSNFSLNDDGVGTDSDYLRSFANLIRFGAVHSIKITEGQNRVMETSAINCTSDPKGGPGINNNNIFIATQSVEIILEEGESVTCTFVNTLRPTSAFATVDGRVMTKAGFGLPRTVVQLIPASGGTEAFRTITGPFGYYRFEDVPTGITYVATATNKGYIFDPPPMIVSINDSITGLDFVAVDNP